MQFSLRCFLPLERLQQVTIRVVGPEFTIEKLALKRIMY